MVSIYSLPLKLGSEVRNELERLVRLSHGLIGFARLVAGQVSVEN